ncbi:MAG: PepSY-associated TM helix domain-containing protein [Gemmataceae bacterium]
MKFHVFNRKYHYWASLVVAIPVLVVIVTGLLLLVKKEFDWIQPPSQRGAKEGSTSDPTISFSRILEVCRTSPETTHTDIRSWDDVDRIDVRPSRRILKVRGKNNWEIQLHSQTGEVLQVAYRRSDIIEAIHDGSWFHDSVKLWVFLPSAVVLLTLWITGMYLFWLPIARKAKRKRTSSAPTT